MNRISFHLPKNILIATYYSTMMLLIPSGNGSLFLILLSLFLELLMLALMYFGFALADPEEPKQRTMSIALGCAVFLYFQYQFAVEASDAVNEIRPGRVFVLIAVLSALLTYSIQAVLLYKRRTGIEFIAKNIIYQVGLIAAIGLAGVIAGVGFKIESVTVLIICMATARIIFEFIVSSTVGFPSE